MRKTIIAGNWKMFKTTDEALDFLQKLGELPVEQERRIILCAPYLSLQSLKEAAQAPVEICAQNVHQEKEGAYTGEISARMLKSIGIHQTLIGHSERRAYFGEGDEIVASKVAQALKEEMQVILCVGEQLEERESGEEEAVVSRQTRIALEGVTKEQLERVTIAYEPVWAIGTGKTASSADAQAMGAFLRSVLTELYDEETADACSLLYGGSVKPENIEELLAQPDVDGVLVGGASLEPQSFRTLALAGRRP